VWRCLGRGIAELVVEASGAESTDYTISHSLATLDGLLVLEIEQNIWLGRSVKAFGVPC